MGLVEDSPSTTGEPGPLGLYWVRMLHLTRLLPSQAGQRVKTRGSQAKAGLEPQGSSPRAVAEQAAAKTGQGSFLWPTVSVPPQVMVTTHPWSA